ncbi:UNVERIFIED_CONTAM: hypothetical protein Slati_0277400 [Sesamum latifolium]|uniref:Uncharacterized protein n=1 Tax=Sesamum latifolium TaxID=2727402 RepID=A0AAW2YE04_9LAMI
MVAHEGRLWTVDVGSGSQLLDGARSSMIRLTKVRMMMITRAPGWGCNVIHPVPSPRNTCRPLVLLWWRMFRMVESVCAAMPMAYQDLGKADMS